MSVLNQYHSLPPTPPHRALDCARMGIAAHRSANLLQYWAPPVCNFTEHGENSSPRCSFDTGSETSQEEKVLAILAQGRRNKPHESIYGFLWVSKPSFLEGWATLHIAPGLIVPWDNPGSGVVYSWELKTGSTDHQWALTPTPVPYEMIDPTEDYTAWVTIRRTDTDTGTCTLRAASFMWV